MNEERIKLLAEQAEKECINVTENFAWEWEKKFAELIVRECSQICKKVNSVKVVNAPDNYQEGREMGVLSCVEKIKQHFGAKE